MQNGWTTNGRIIDTFQARELEVPNSLKNTDSTGKYLIRQGKGLELKKHRRNGKGKLVI